jgi:hypothetical protein
MGTAVQSGALLQGAHSISSLIRYKKSECGEHVAEVVIVQACDTASF